MGDGVDAGTRVTLLAQSARHRLNGQVGRFDVGHLVPFQGAGDPGIGDRAHRVGAGHGAVPGVLVVVDEHPVTFLLPPLAGGQGGGAPLDLAGQCQRGAADGGEAVLGDDPHVDVDAPRARGLGVPAEAHLLQHLAHHQGDPADVGERHLGLGVEVDAQLVGMIGVAAAHRPGVDVDAAEVHRPEQGRRQVDDQQAGAASAREVDRCGAQVRDVAHRGALLEEEGAGGPVGVALEHRGTVEAAGQRAVGHRQVVLHQLPLGDPPLCEENLVGIGDREVVAVDLDAVRAHPATRSEARRRIPSAPPRRSQA